MHIKPKIVLFVLLPIFLFFGLITLFDYQATRARITTQVKVNLQDQAQLYANQVDTLVREASSIALTTANFVSSHQSFQESMLYEVIGQNIQNNPLIYGATIAFEPGEFAGRALFSPYVYHAANGLKQLDLGTASYDYTKPQWHWYAIPRQTGRALWSEPYFDEGGGNIEMVTFSMPFFRSGHFAGVTTVDLDISHLLGIAGLDKLDRQNTFIVTQSGHFVFHHDKRWLGKRWQDNQNEFPPSQANKLSQVLQGRAAQIFELSEPNGKSLWVASAPVTGANWNLIVRIDAQEALAEINEQATRSAKLIVIALVLALLVSWFLLTRIVNPIGRLAEIARQIAEGKPDADVIAESKDEVGELSKSFALMAEKLKAREAALIQSNTALKTQIQERTEELEKRIRTEQILRYSEEKFAVAFNSNPTAFCIIRREDGLLLEVNKAFEDLLEYRHDDLVRKTIAEIDFWVDLSTRPEIVDFLLEENPARSGETRWRTRSGKIRTVIPSAELVTLDGVSFLLTSIVDITERKQTEYELNHYRRHLEDLVATRTAELEIANQRLKEIDQLKSMFIASMSHELRTPLNAIIGFSGMLYQGLSGDLTDEQKHDVERIYRAGNHLLELITDVIDISKIEAGRVDTFPREFSLKELVDEAVATIQPLADAKSLTVTVTPPAAWPRVVTDRKRVLQCLLNVLGNAVKYSEHGGIVLSVHDRNDDFEFSVRDTGIGIAPEDLHKLFEAFERLDSHLRIKAGGTGLGLYLTRKIITDILGGEITVESRPGVGSTFTMHMPKVMHATSGATHDKVATLLPQKQGLTRSTEP